MVTFFDGGARMNPTGDGQGRRESVRGLHTRGADREGDVRIRVQSPPDTAEGGQDLVILSGNGTFCRDQSLRLMTSCRWSVLSVYRN